MNLSLNFGSFHSDDVYFVVIISDQNNFHFILHILYSNLRHEQSLQRLFYSVIGSRRGTGWRDVLSTQLMLIGHRKNIKEQMLALWLTELTRFTGKKKCQHPVEKTNFCL